VVFTILEGLFEPTVMSFGLTNSPAIFHTTINKVLWDLINTKKIVSFIDDVIIVMEEKDRYDELVEEVVKRLMENDLYIKPEKYKWKIRKVGFLGVVIGPERIKMEEEKVKGILE